MFFKESFGKGWVLRQSGLNIPLSYQSVCIQVPLPLQLATNVHPRSLAQTLLLLAFGSELTDVRFISLSVSLALTFSQFLLSSFEIDTNNK